MITRAKLIGMILITAAAVLSTSMLQAATSKTFAVVTNYNDRSITTVDFSTSPPTVYGPFLAGQLGSSYLFGVKMTPDGRYALVASYGQKTVYRIDLSDPTAPVLAGSLMLQNNAEQIAMSPDGTFAMVTDGSAYNLISVIDMADFSLKTTFQVPGASFINGIAIAPDHTTWVAADYGDKEIWYGTYSPSDGMLLKGSLPTDGGPMSVAISPDGKTVLVTCQPHSVDAYQITAPGTVVPGENVTGLPYPQSAAFSPDGRRAYVLNATGPSVLSVLDVPGPGQISLVSADTVVLGRRAGSFYGIDCLAPTPDGRAIVVGNNGTKNLALVDASNLTVTTIPTDTNVPMGVATIVTDTNPCAPVTISPPALSDGTAGVFYSQGFSASGGGGGAFDFSLSGTLPKGLALTGDTLSGTPTQTGTFHFTITAEDAVYGCTSSRSYTLTIGCPSVAILPASLPSGVDHESYAADLVAPAGIAPVVFTITSGTLPSGMSLSTSGAITGTPNRAGTFTFTITAADANGCTGQRSYSLTVYSESFFGDTGAAAMCLNSQTGMFQWTIRTGRYAGMTYTGNLAVYNGGTMFWSQPGASQYVYVYYDPNGHMAWGYLYDYSTGLYSSLYDSDTLNDPPGCGALPAT